MTSFYDWYGDLPVASPRVFGDQTDVPLVMGATYGEVTRSYTIGLVLGRRARVSSPVRGSARRCEGPLMLRRGGLTMTAESYPPGTPALPPPHRVLSTERCRQLLAEHHIGRIAWKGADGLQLLPVSYALHHGVVVFRTSPYGVLSELVRPVEVIFEVDELDSELRTGWSVVVTGRAQAVAEPRDLVELWTVDGVTPWSAGVRTLFIEVTPRQITGRLFGASD